MGGIVFLQRLYPASQADTMDHDDAEGKQQDNRRGRFYPRAIEGIFGCCVGSSMDSSGLDSLDSLDSHPPPSETGQKKVTKHKVWARTTNMFMYLCVW